MKNLRTAEDDFLCFTTPFIEPRTSLQWIVELEGNIRGNDYLMTFEELGVEARGGGKAGEARGGGEGVL